MKRLEPVVRARQQEESRVLAHNLKVIGLEDPVQNDQIETEIKYQIEEAGDAINLDETLPVEDISIDIDEDDFI
jgi:hypothetical protein